MYLTAEKDIYGNSQNFTSDKFRRILDLLNGYMKYPYTICEMRQDNVNDPHGRIDIEVRYTNENNRIIHQKLLILDDELIDGSTFHKRYEEFKS